MILLHGENRGRAYKFLRDEIFEYLKAHPAVETAEADDLAE